MMDVYLKASKVQKEIEGKNFFSKYLKSCLALTERGKMAEFSYYIFVNTNYMNMFSILWTQKISLHGILEFYVRVLTVMDGMVFSVKIV